MIDARAIVSTLDGVCQLSEVRLGDWIEAPDGFSKVTAVANEDSAEAMDYVFRRFLKQMAVSEPLDWLTEMACQMAAEFDGKKATLMPQLDFPLMLERHIIVSGQKDIYRCPKFHITGFNSTPPKLPSNYSKHGPTNLSSITFLYEKVKCIGLRVDNNNNSFYANDLEVYGI